MFELPILCAFIVPRISCVGTPNSHLHCSNGGNARIRRCDVKRMVESGRPVFRSSVRACHMHLALRWGGISGPKPKIGFFWLRRFVCDTKARACKRTGVRVQRATPRIGTRPKFRISCDSHPNAERHRAPRNKNFTASSDDYRKRVRKFCYNARRKPERQYWYNYY